MLLNKSPHIGGWIRMKIKPNVNPYFELIAPVSIKKEKKKNRFLWCLSIFGVLSFGWVARKINGL